MEKDTVIREGVQPEVAQTEKIGLGDLIIAAVLAAATWFFLSLWQFPMMMPETWQDATVAAGIRPAIGTVPGYFRFIGGLVYDSVGVAHGEAVLRLMGHISLSVIAVIVYAVFRELLAFIMRARPQMSKRRSIVMQLASVVGACAFVCSDAVWAAGQFFGETTILIGLTLVAIELFFVFLRKGSLKYAYLCAIACGLLVAESPLGFVLAGVFVFINQFVLKVIPTMESPFYNPALIAVGKWYMTFLFLAGIIAGIALNCWTFCDHLGLDAVGQSIGNLPLDYLVGYWQRVTSAADIMGWVLIVGFAVAPFVVTLVCFPAAADEDVFLEYSTGLVFLVCALVAVAQASPLPSLWFWSYATFGSSYFLAMGNFLSATTLAGAVTILGVDALCRNHERLADQVFAVSDDDEEGPMPRKEVKVNSRTTTKILRLAGLAIVPTAIILAMIPGRVEKGLRGILGLVRDYAHEVVSESEGATYVFTDGNLDAAVEMASAVRGGKLMCLNLVGTDAPMDTYLRTRGLKNDDEDYFSFHHDAGMGLRTWMRDRPKRLDKATVQLGFDLWKRDGRNIPPMGGLVSRPNGWRDETVRLATVANANALAARALALAKDGATKECPDKKVKDAFAAVLWRLARMCVYRAEGADVAGDVKTAIAEMDMAKELNERNEVFQELVKVNEQRNELLMQRLTPREGLQLALVRADFTMGKVYAELILHAEPENADANFVMGMYYLKQRQLTRAEEYLKRCLILKPKEPAIYNNLAMIQMELGKFDAAEKNVRRALELAPGSIVIRDTEKLLRERRSDRQLQKNLTK